MEILLIIYSLQHINQKSQCHIVLIPISGKIYYIMNDSNEKKDLLGVLLVVVVIAGLLIGLEWMNKKHDIFSVIGKNVFNYIK